MGEIIPVLIDDAAGRYTYLRWTPDDSDVALVVLNNGAAAANVRVDIGSCRPGGLGYLPPPLLLG